MNREPSPQTPGQAQDWAILALLVLATPVVAYGVLTVRSETDGVVQWLPSDTPESSRYFDFVDLFGIDDFVIASWTGCTLDDPRLEKFAAAVRDNLGARGGDPPLVAEVTTAADVAALLRAPPLSLSPRQTQRRLQGFLLGPEGTAAVVIQATPAGARRQKDLVDDLTRIAHDAAGVPPEALYLGGTIFESVAIERESFASLKQFVVPSALVVVALAWLTVRDLRLVIIMLGLSVFCQALSVATLTFTGRTIDAVLIVMPTLVYVTAMSSSLHLVNYYRFAAAAGEADPARWALRHGWKPCASASLTTAIGLASLGVSQVKPVRDFGWYASANVCVSLLVVLIALTPALRLFHRPRRAEIIAERSDFAAARAWQRRLAAWTLPVLVAFALCLIVGTLGIARLRSSLNLQQMFPADSTLVRNYQWLEQHVGPLISIEILATIRDVDSLDRYQVLEALAALEQAAAAMPEVKSTTSALAYLPSLSRTGDLRAVAERAMVRRHLETRRDDLRRQRLLAQNGDDEVWRITARVSALGGLEYGDYTAELAQRVDAQADKLPTEIRERLAVDYTGLTPVVYQAQRQMLSDLFNSFLGAFALITPIMMYQVRSVVGGLLAMIPNVLPVAVVFGALGWLGVPVNIGVILTASLGLGIAVDGTLHFLGWYRSRLAAGETHDQALVSALATCSAAMIQATLIIGLGLLVYAFSDFIPTVRFAWMLLILQLIALACDLVLMPAILTSPLGRFFRRRLDSSS